MLLQDNRLCVTCEPLGKRSANKIYKQELTLFTSHVIGMSKSLSLAINFQFSSEISTVYPYTLYI